MAQNPPEFATFSAEIISAKDHPCRAGHKLGDKFTFSCWDSGGLCGFFYHNVFPLLATFTFGDGPPWAAEGELMSVCPDPRVDVTLKITKNRPQKS